MNEEILKLKDEIKELNKIMEIALLLIQRKENQIAILKKNNCKFEILEGQIENNIGTKKLNKLLKQFKKMNTDEYEKLYKETLKY